MGTERERVDGFGRLEAGLRQAGDWYRWGPYVSERQWGTVREDYSPDGQAWDYLPHDHARSRAYRWGDDGLAGFCDIEQRLCLGLALWNGRDPILKERAFGLTGAEANHGEDVKEYWWYLDALPSHAWNRWRYHYPQAAFPYEDLREVNGRRGKLDPEYELLDTDAFAGDRYWIVEVQYAKADPQDLLMSVKVTNAGPDPDTLHVLPSAPGARAQASGAGGAPGCAFGSGGRVPAGATVDLHLRLRPRVAASDPRTALGPDFDEVVATRQREADEFYAELTPKAASADEATVMRQAFSGMLWSKQPYHYDVGRWLDGDPTQPRPPESRLWGRNVRWRNFDAFDIMSMPDKWEYPWFAAWDLAFHCVALAHVDPAFAKYQLILLCREWFQHPSGALPAYEWDFGDVNPPVQAFAALEVFAIDGGRDVDFLSRIFDKLLVNFTWRGNREDAEGNNLFEGGFLGLDNIGPIDRSHLPAGDTLEQSDATGWMAFYAIAMGGIAAVLNRSGRRPANDLVMKFLEHSASISDAIDGQGIWDDTDGLYYDRLLTPDGADIPVKVRSMVGMIPMLAVAVIDDEMLDRSLTLGKHFADFLKRQGLDDREKLQQLGVLRGEPGHQRLLLSVVDLDRLEKLFARLFDEAEFLSPYGPRALAAYHRDHPYTLDIQGSDSTIDYEPAEANTAQVGRDPKRRGPR